MGAYLVTGRRVGDGWPFAGEFSAASPQSAIETARAWGIEPEFVKDLETDVVHLGEEEDDGSDGSEADDADDADDDAAGETDETDPDGPEAGPNGGGNG